jgi:MSHA pilin protein MshA
MIIVILGILAAVAIPKYFDLQTNAKSAAEKGVVGGVRSGISTYYANACNTGTCAYPTSLESTSFTGSCTTTNKCFDNVLAQPITADWTRATSDTYTGPAGTTYTYTSSDGSFK